MPVSDAKRRNNDKYNAKCDRITVWPLKPEGAAIRAAAAAAAAAKTSATATAEAASAATAAKAPAAAAAAPEAAGGTAAAGQSLRGYILQAVRERMAKEGQPLTLDDLPGVDSVGGDSVKP